MQKQISQGWNIIEGVKSVKQEERGEGRKESSRIKASGFRKADLNILLGTGGQDLMGEET